MSDDIRDAVARAIYAGRYSGEPGWEFDTETQDIRDDYTRDADAALSVARPLIEAEARERALREALALGKRRAASLRGMPFPDMTWQAMALGAEAVTDDVRALLPAPTQEPTNEVHAPTQEPAPHPASGVAMVMAADLHAEDQGNACVGTPAAPDEWIKWRGGECPVATDTHVEVKFSNGHVDRDEYAAVWDWSHYSDDDGGNIIAYRIVKEPADVTNAMPPRDQSEDLSHDAG